MNRETSRSSARIAPERRLRRARSSGREAGRVKVGHDKMGRAKYRPEGTMAVRRGRAHMHDAEPDPVRYPNMAARRELEHAQHVSRAMQMGLTRKQAEAHARQDERDGLRDASKIRRAGRVRTGTSL